MYKEKKLFAIEFKLLSEYVIPKNISNGSLFIDSIGKLKQFNSIKGFGLNCGEQLSF